MRREDNCGSPFICRFYYDIWVVYEELKSTKLVWGEVGFAWMLNEAFIGFGNNFASSSVGSGFADFVDGA